MIKKRKRILAKDVFFDGKMNVIWKDGTHTAYEYWDLRTSCPCAECVDEVTGKKILDDSTVDKNIHPVKSEYVGNYALRIYWSDNHSIGLFSFEELRDNLPCEVITGHS